MAGYHDDNNNCFKYKQLLPLYIIAKSLYSIAYETALINPSHCETAAFQVLIDNNFVQSHSAVLSKIRISNYKTTFYINRYS